MHFFYCVMSNIKILKHWDILIIDYCDMRYCDFGHRDYDIKSLKICELQKFCECIMNVYLIYQNIETMCF